MSTNPGNPNLWTRWDRLLQNVERSPDGLLALLDPTGRISYANQQPPQSDTFVFFKGSFNPIHNGHISLFTSAISKWSKSAGAFALSFLTFKGPVRREDIVFRSRLIHLAGYPVIVSRSGRFSHVAKSFYDVAPRVHLVFPVGIDVLRRLLDYYEVGEFEKLFQNSTFEYFGREGFDKELPLRYRRHPQVSLLGDNPYLSINSKKLWRLRAERAKDEVRAVMPAGAVEYFLSTAPSSEVTIQDENSTTSSFIPRKTVLEVFRAEGSYFFLRDGRRILDAAGGSGVANVGHGRAEVINAISQALANLSYAIPGFAVPERSALIEHLQTHWLPKGLSRVHLLGGGSDAVEAAVKLARNYQVACGRVGRWKTIGRDVSYHGATLGALAIGGHDGRKAGLGDLLPELPHAPACYCLRCPFGKTYPSCEVECAHALEELITKEGVETIAAFIAEPIVGFSGGALVPPNEYWSIVRDICQRHNILLIADEITTGFGRTGKPFALEAWDVRPDILVVGKGLTGGYAPLAAVCASEMVVDQLASMGMNLVSHTFDGHPGSCAAARSVLELILRDQLLDRVRENGQLLGELLVSSLRDHPCVAQIRGRGLLWAVEIVRDRATLERFPRSANLTRKIVYEGIERGVFFYPGGTTTERDIIVMSPPFIIEADEIAQMVNVLKNTIDQVVNDVAPY